MGKGAPPVGQEDKQNQGHLTAQFLHFEELPVSSDANPEATLETDQSGDGYVVGKKGKFVWRIGHGIGLLFRGVYSAQQNASHLDPRQPNLLYPGANTKAHAAFFTYDEDTQFLDPSKPVGRSVRKLLLPDGKRIQAGTMGKQAREQLRRDSQKYNVYFTRVTRVADQFRVGVDLLGLGIMVGQWRETGEFDPEEAAILALDGGATSLFRLSKKYQQNGSLEIQGKNGDTVLGGRPKARLSPQEILRQKIAAEEAAYQHYRKSMQLQMGIFFGLQFAYSGLKLHVELGRLKKDFRDDSMLDALDASTDMGQALSSGSMYYYCLRESKLIHAQAMAQTSLREQAVLLGRATDVMNNKMAVFPKKLIYPMRFFAGVTTGIGYYKSGQLYYESFASETLTEEERDSLRFAAAQGAVLTTLLFPYAWLVKGASMFFGMGTGGVALIAMGGMNMIELVPDLVDYVEEKYKAEVDDIHDKFGEHADVYAILSDRIDQKIVETLTGVSGRLYNVNSGSWESEMTPGFKVGEPPSLTDCQELIQTGPLEYECVNEDFKNLSYEMPEEPELLIMTFVDEGLEGPPFDEEDLGSTIQIAVPVMEDEAETSSR